MLQIFHALRLAVKKAEKVQRIQLPRALKIWNKIVNYLVLLNSHYRGSTVLFQIFHALRLAVKKAEKAQRIQRPRALKIWNKISHYIVHYYIPTVEEVQFCSSFFTL